MTLYPFVLLKITENILSWEKFRSSVESTRLSVHEAPIANVFVDSRRPVPEHAGRVGRIHTNTQKIKEAKTLTDVTGADVTARSEGKSRPVVEARHKCPGGGPVQSRALLV